MGYPTANLRLHQDIPQGIYISKTSFDGKIFSSITFVGNATTFNDKNVNVETHILNFDKNIYNSWITVQLLKKIRKNKKFDSEEALVRQISEDVEIAKKYFKIKYYSCPADSGKLEVEARRKCQYRWSVFDS